MNSHWQKKVYFVSGIFYLYLYFIGDTVSIFLFGHSVWEINPSRIIYRAKRYWVDEGEQAVVLTCKVLFDVDEGVQAVVQTC